MNGSYLKRQPPPLSRKGIASLSSGVSKFLDKPSVSIKHCDFKKMVCLLSKTGGPPDRGLCGLSPDLQEGQSLAIVLYWSIQPVATANLTMGFKASMGTNG